MVHWRDKSQHLTRYSFRDFYLAPNAVGMDCCEYIPFSGVKKVQTPHPWRCSHLPRFYKSAFRVFSLLLEADQVLLVFPLSSSAESVDQQSAV